MKTILQAIKAIDEEAEGTTIAKALGGTATISEAISEYEGGGGGDGDETTYYTLNFDMSGKCEYMDSDNHIWDMLPAEAHPAGTVVDLSEDPTRGYTFMPNSSSYEFDGWILGGVVVTEVTMSGNIILTASLVQKQGG